MTSQQSDEAFVEHYQFRHDPFTPRVPGFKFYPAQRKPVLAQLHQLARYSALMLVVSGPLGSGKTLLRQALVASSNKQSVVSVVVSARQAGSSQATSPAKWRGAKAVASSSRSASPSPAKSGTSAS